MQRLAEAARALPGATVTARADYLHVEFASRVMGFIDWLEAVPDPSGVIHVRSAARVGEGDFGVNRRRVERLRDAFVTAHARAAPAMNPLESGPKSSAPRTCTACAHEAEHGTVAASVPAPRRRGRSAGRDLARTAHVAGPSSAGAVRAGCAHAARRAARAAASARAACAACSPR